MIVMIGVIEVIAMVAMVAMIAIISIISIIRGGEVRRSLDHGLGRCGWLSPALFVAVITCATG